MKKIIFFVVFLFILLLRTGSYSFPLFNYDTRAYAYIVSSHIFHYNGTDEDEDEDEGEEEDNDEEDEE